MKEIHHAILCIFKQIRGFQHGKCVCAGFEEKRMRVIVIALTLTLTLTLTLFYAPQVRLELTTYGLTVRRSDQLSY